MTKPVLIAVVAILLIAVAAVLIVRLRGLRPVPPQMRAGQKLPEFDAEDEKGDPVSSADLRGGPAVILFVRGNWCPFCNAQVENLTDSYRDIADLGARLILLTPKPLSTTRRVAEFFRVEFEYWLDDGLHVARRFGLLLGKGVPRDYRDEYGDDTVWPAAIVTDADGVIQFAALSKHISDRPDPGTLLRALRKIVRS